MKGRPRYPRPIFGYAIVGSVAMGFQASSYGLTPFQQSALWIAIVASVLGGLVSLPKREQVREIIARSALVGAVIFLSTFSFVGSATVLQAIELVELQNRAALRLWASVLVTDHLSDELADFSRRDQQLLRLADQLNTWWMPNRSQNRLRYEELSAAIENIPALDRILGPPPDRAHVKEITRTTIGMYQRIRDFALEVVKLSDIVYYRGLTFYVLPVLYSILGVSLRRSGSHTVGAAEQLVRARYFIAAAAGLLLDMLGSFVPTGGFATAFLIGLSIPIAISAVSFMAGNRLELLLTGWSLPKG